MLKQFPSKLLMLCAFLVFIARAYQFYFFGAPFRAIFWDESLLSPIVEGIFNYTWYDYASSQTTNMWIEKFTKGCSVLFLISGCLSLFWQNIKWIRFKKVILGTSIFFLVFLGICMVKDKNYDILQFFELSIQIIVPLILYLNPDLSKVNSRALMLWLKTSIVLTFVPHGLFAMGLIYVPGHFIDMTIKIIGLTETQSILFLYIVGFLDLLISVLIFFPKVAKYAVGYAITWGFLTAFARLASGFNAHFFWPSIHNYTYLVVYRLPHGLIPLIVYLLLPKTQTLTKKLVLNDN
jgi:hypothetical protein